ncbi:monocarboxylate transporter 1 [Ixodes scapularis]
MALQLSHLRHKLIAFKNALESPLAAGVLARYISVWKLTLAGSVVSAMSVSLCYFANGIPYLIAFYGILQGWSAGATEILIHVFFMELVESANFSVCFGAASLMAGLSGLARPPIIGHFRDGLGSYRGLFWLLGTLSACNVVLWCGLCLRERRRCNERNLDKRQPKEHPQA